MKVDQECAGCVQCAAYCPYDAITVFGRAMMNEKCIECGKYIRCCPVSAVSGEG